MLSKLSLEYQTLSVTVSSCNSKTWCYRSKDEENRDKEVLHSHDEQIWVLDAGVKRLERKVRSRKVVEAGRDRTRP